ncbi:unnamed protein product [Clonostachys rosea]|uniref:Uncharacterized protein n=1 Tax=Bionectria ochroleuca TaxID=29856 RepID=A0ABY6UQ41_BIOOC|nr:unnamed protein product [Clonostachys rosea]
MYQTLMQSSNPSAIIGGSKAWQMTQAALDNDFLLVKYLIEDQRLDVNGADYDGSAPDSCRYLAEQLRVPVIIATTLERFEIATYLLEKGAHVNARTPKTKETLLHKAAEKGNLAFLNLVLELPGIEIDPLDSKCETPAVKAVRTNQLEAVQILLQHGASANIPLPMSVELGRTPFVEVLLDHGADPEQTGHDERPILYIAAQRGNTLIVQALLEAGAHDDPASRACCPALAAAASQGQNLSVQLLLARGWNPDGDGPDAEHLPPLHTALKHGHTHVATHLLKKGADVNMLDASGIPPVFYAAEQGSVLGLNLLKDRGADMHINVNGVTAIQKAKKGGNRHAVRFLRRD